VSLALGYALAATAAAAVALSPLPAAAWALLVIAVLAGAAWDRWERHRLPAPLLTALGLAGFAASLIPLRRETLAEQSLTALSFLLAVKLLAVKRRRDHLQLLAISLMLVAGAASLDPALAFAGLLLVTFLLGVCLLLWLPFSEAGPAATRGLLRRLAALAALLALGSLPLSLLLFLLLPRTMNPFWASGFGMRRQGVSGISDQMRLGEVARVALSTAVAFRAELEGPGGPLPAVPYWRGAVLEATDGRRWSVVPRYRPPTRAPLAPGARITYFAEPSGERQLFLLETPTGASVGARLQPIGASRVLRLPLPLERPIRYVATSLPGDRFAETLTAEERALNLAVPAGTPAPVLALGAQLAGDRRDPTAIVGRVLAHFASGYRYTLEIPGDAGDPLEAFLFRTRAGYCEYFAAAAATLLRIAGVPARVVDGYLGGEYVAGGNYYLVTQAAAHAWVEAYLGDSWVRIDPTPAAGETGATFAARRGRRPLLWLDSLRMRWNAWFVQYDAESQLTLARAGASRLRALHFEPARLARPAAYAAAAAALLAAIALALRRRGSDPLAARERRFLALAAAAGVPRAPHDGPLDHAARFARARPAAANAATRFAAAHAACRYGGRAADAEALAALDALLAAISRSRGPAAASLRRSGHRP
jgi:transglutaminase-like putative cysteine protease